MLWIVFYAVTQARKSARNLTPALALHAAQRGGKFEKENTFLWPSGATDDSQLQVVMSNRAANVRYLLIRKGRRLRSERVMIRLPEMEQFIVLEFSAHGQVTDWRRGRTQMPPLGVAEHASACDLLRIIREAAGTSDIVQ